VLLSFEKEDAYEMNKAKKTWALFEDVSAGTFFSVGIALIFYGVLMRYAFNSPKAWIEEVSSYCIVWGALLGIPIALRNNHHIQVDMLYDKMSPAMKRLMDLFANLVSILFCLFYTYYGALLVLKRYTSGLVSLDVGIPMWIIYLILPISGILFLARFIERLINVIRGKGEEQHG
jgi:C4-dicarboxylate transporter DctQ subunit